jgi:hypothetical protein
VVSSTPWPHFTPGKDPVPIVLQGLYFITKGEHVLKIRLYDGQIMFLDFNWVRRAQESFQWRPFVDTINNFRFQKVKEFLGQLGVCYILKKRLRPIELVIWFAVIVGLFTSVRMLFIINIHYFSLLSSS